MGNLLIETRNVIKHTGHTIEDIVFIGSERSGHCCAWEEFEILADREYDSGFGAQKVASDLIIVFSDGMKMWRHEYDGSEYWSYSAPFTMPKEFKPIESLFANSVGWENLAEIHGEGDD